jgi:hypothetical protein
MQACYFDKNALRVLKGILGTVSYATVGWPGPYSGGYAACSGVAR